MKRKLLGILILGMISGIGLSYALNVTQTLDNTVAYIKKMIWTTNGADNGVKKVIIDGGDGSITMLGALNIQTGALKDRTVVTNDLADGAITNSKIANNAVNSANIEDSSIGTIDIGVNQVTNRNLGNDAVDSAKIQDGSITSGDLSFSLRSSLGGGTPSVSISTMGKDDSWAQHDYCALSVVQEAHSPGRGNCVLHNSDNNRKVTGNGRGCTAICMDFN